MALFGELKRYRDERDALIQHRHNRDSLLERLNETTAGLKRNSQEYQIAVGDYFATIDIVDAEIAEIETAQTLRRAGQWRILTPQRPYKEDEDNDFWEWHGVHGRYYLTEEAMRRVRREVYEEREMRMKPWLTWLAVLISVISLAISVLKS
ncbi:hypothetical protein [Mesorhizobium neociceri]|uniref:Uncharacterized protein n=1 Tax=Mesorhizobium neociceri TaxID=1307853 RepID=A0A838B0L2_9HYPH|nr:hypothetical protein [Mesorhizobium neociceri]MBA1139374.1 hypothetical protein [Mesorhizobium neociceri]